MVRKLFCGFVSLLLTSQYVLGVISTEITYTATNLGFNQWQYAYQVTNIALSTPIKELTIWFDYGLYQDLSIVTLGPTADNWDEVAWQPEQGLGNGGYDALTIGPGIGLGETVSGFCVRFNWLGTGVPGSQFYEIINPSDFSRIDSGFTIPEPASLFMFGIGSVFLLRRRREK